MRRADESSGGSVASATSAASWLPSRGVRSGFTFHSAALPSSSTAVGCGRSSPAVVAVEPGAKGFVDSAAGRVDQGRLTSLASAGFHAVRRYAAPLSASAPVPGNRTRVSLGWVRIQPLNTLPPRLYSCPRFPLSFLSSLLASPFSPSPLLPSPIPTHLFHWSANCRESTPG